jgi:hypothetical protein
MQQSSTFSVRKAMGLWFVEEGDDRHMKPTAALALELAVSLAARRTALGRFATVEMEDEHGLLRTVWRAGEWY